MDAFRRCTLLRVWDAGLQTRETFQFARVCGRVIGSPPKLWIDFFGSPRDYQSCSEPHGATDTFAIVDLTRVQTTVQRNSTWRCCAF
jgi:hypothetical protein